MASSGCSCPWSACGCSRETKTFASSHRHQQWCWLSKLRRALVMLSPGAVCRGMAVAALMRHGQWRCRMGEAADDEDLFCGFRVHEAADKFPLLSGDEFQRLKDSIRDNGFLEPAVLFDGEILDGRNRILAATELGVPIVTRDYAGECGDPWTFVFSTNIVRRHLSDAAKIRLVKVFEGAIASAAKARMINNGGGRPGKTLPPKGGKVSKIPPPRADAIAKQEAIAKVEQATNEAKPSTTAGALASMAGVSERNLERYNRVAKTGEDGKPIYPDLIAKVDNGQMPISAAEAEVARRESATPPKPKKEAKPKDPKKDISKKVRALIKRLLEAYPDERETITNTLLEAAEEVT